MLSTQTAQKVIDCALSQSASFIDLFIEKNQALSVVLKSKNVDQISDGIDFGIGIRVIFGTKALYGYTNSSELDELIRITNLLCALDRKKASPLPINFTKTHTAKFSPTILGLNQTVGLEEKIRYLKSVDEATRIHSEKITQVEVRSSERFQQVEIFNSFGLHAEDQRFYTRIAAIAIASDGGKQDSAFYGPGGFGGWELTRKIDPKLIPSNFFCFELYS